MVADIYRLFVFDGKGRIPVSDSEAELVTLARDYGSRVDSEMTLTLAELLESAERKKAEPAR